jgi:hypothetical protein
MVRPDQTPIAPAVGDALLMLVLMTAQILRSVLKDDAA